jgi:heme-degrading monooxygenase HmoA
LTGHITCPDWSAATTNGTDAEFHDSAGESFTLAAKYPAADCPGFIENSRERPAMSDVLIVSNWDSEEFHRQVRELESQGYIARQETYRITPEMNPESGRITHLYSIEMYRESEEVGEAEAPSGAN